MIISFNPFICRLPSLTLMKTNILRTRNPNKKPFAKIIQTTSAGFFFPNGIAPHLDPFSFVVWQSRQKLYMSQISFAMIKATDV